MLLRGVFFPFVCLFVCAEQRIDACLIPAPLRFEPIKHVAIQAEGDLCLPSHRLETTTNDCLCEHLRRNSRSLGQINVVVF